MTTIKTLTPRQHEVLTRFGRGERIKDICTALGLSRGAVSTHRDLAMRKLGLKNIADVVLYVASR